MTVIDFIGQFKTELWSSIVDFTISSAVIAVIASLFTEAVKISVNKVFLRKNFHHVVSLILNIVVIVVLSIIFVLAFDSRDGILANHLYITMLIFLAWPISILTYTFIIKLFTTLFEIIYSKTKTYGLASETEMINTTLDYNKTKELLEENLLLSDLKQESNDKRK